MKPRCFHLHCSYSRILNVIVQSASTHHSRLTINYTDSCYTASLQYNICFRSRYTALLSVYSYSTEKTYVHWAKRYILFQNKRHPAEMGAPEIEAFLSHLDQEGNVSASTQNQAINAILFLYRNVLKIELTTPVDVLCAKRSQYLPTVLSKNEVNQVLGGMQGLHQLMARLLYGCGLRLM